VRSLGVIDTAVIGESVLSNDYRNIIVRRLDPLQQFAQPPWHHLHHSSTQLAQELVTMNIDDKHKCLILYIKDLYVNIPIKEIIGITKIFLINKSTTKDITKQYINSSKRYSIKTVSHAKENAMDTTKESP
jgi:hypothetical protein